MTKLRSKPRKKSLLIIGIIFALAWTGFIFWFSPNTIWSKVIFFVLFIFSWFYFLSFVFNQTTRALTFTSGLTALLILRLLGLRHWLYLVLIAAIIISVEISQRKKLL